MTTEKLARQLRDKALKYNKIATKLEVVDKNINDYDPNYKSSILNSGQTNGG